MTRAADTAPGAVENTDRELWRERDGDYYADSIHVTEHGSIGIDCGGTVIVKPLREWHELAARNLTPANTAPGAVEPESFWAKVDRRGPDECWPWLGTNNGGYGTLWLNGRSQRATRISWSLANGKPFPDGMCACHTCDNPICVNPAHLWPGTMRDNMMDAREKGRLPRMNRSHCPQGHALEGRNVMMVNGGKHRQCRICHTKRSRMRQRKRRDRDLLDRLKARAEKCDWVGGDMVNLFGRAATLIEQQAATIAELRGGLTLATAKLAEIGRWREDCHAYDADAGHDPRDFDGEDWDMVEDAARRAAEIARTTLNRSKGP